MSYRLKCTSCRNTFISTTRQANCPSWTCSGSSSSLASDVVDLAVDVALAYTGVTAAIEIADAGLGFVSSFFD